MVTVAKKKKKKHIIWAPNTGLTKAVPMLVLIWAWKTYNSDFTGPMKKKIDSNNIEIPTTHKKIPRNGEVRINSEKDVKFFKFITF